MRLVIGMLVTFLSGIFLSGCAPFGYTEGYAKNHDWTLEIDLADSKLEDAPWLVVVRHARPLKPGLTLVDADGNTKAVTTVTTVPPAIVIGELSGFRALDLAEHHNTTLTFEVVNEYPEYIGSNPNLFQGGTVGAPSKVEDHLTLNGEFWLIPRTSEGESFINQVNNSRLQIVNGRFIVPISEASQRLDVRSLLPVPDSIVRLPFTAALASSDPKRTTLSLPENSWIKRLRLTGNESSQDAGSAT